MMKEKYIKFFKKQLVFLLLLLVVVCFSFGLTYSNFKLKSDEFRAVEMFASKLDYELSESKLIVKPGNNLFRISMKSLNNVESYYKVIYDNKNVNIKYYNNESNKISPNGTIILNLLVFNKTNKNEVVNISVLGGFITNTYDDIKVYDNKYEVSENIIIGDIVTIDNHIYKLININYDGSYELLSDITGDIYNIEGSNGYNQYIDLINDNIIDIEGSIEAHALSIEDIEKYTSNKIVSYDEFHYFEDAYYPSLWEMEEDAIIDNNNQESFYGRSEGVSNGNYEHAPSITIKDISINDISFSNEKYRDIFLGSNYLLATRYQHANKDGAVWGILSIEDGYIKQNELFKSNMDEYVVGGNIRILVLISNDIDLFSKEL